MIDEPATRTLVIRARSGDGAAFELLVRANYDRLYAVARRMVADAGDAEDATQEAFLRGWREIPKLRDPDRYEAWQLRLLIRTCYDLLRGRSRRRLQSAVRPIAELVARPDESVLERERLGRAFSRLPPEQRAAVVLHFYRDMAPAAIADLLQVPVGTISSRLHYGTRALRAALEADERAGTSVGEQSA
ncbi:MAG: sigma-70 family RNA polymerase sigma factor [Chloroflexota bacterium]|nr:MAG: sigma-70 family RNA polymerase sigma factor [Chloroflexota bacterium]